MRVKHRQIAVLLLTLLAVLSVAIVASANDGITQGLVKRWRFDGTLDGASVHSGNPQFVTGVINQAISLNGVNDALALGQGSQYQPANITVSFWIKRTGADWSTGERVAFWAKGDTDWAGNGWFLTIDSRSAQEPVKFWVDGQQIFGVTSNVNSFYPRNTWVHIAVTFSSQTKQYAVYRNGVLQNAQVINGNINNFKITAPSNITTYMGFNSPTWAAAWAEADFDDVRIYNRVLSAQEIATIAAADNGNGDDDVYHNIAPYQHEGINPSNAMYADSAHFRLYYGATGKRGPNNNLGILTAAEVQANLEYLEAAYDLYVKQMGFISPGMSVHDHVGGPYKINVYVYSELGAAGYMGYNATAGLSFLMVHVNSFNRNMNFNSVTAHELGHCMTLAMRNWIDKTNTGAWWETMAQWFAEEFGSSQQFAALASKYGKPTSYTIFNPDVSIANSKLTIVHANNLYQAHYFFTYLDKNPDGWAGLGNNPVRRLIEQHQGNETPLHTLDRMMTNGTVQDFLAYYNARLAFMDFGNPLAQQALVNRQGDSNFRNAAYSNLQHISGNTYRVKTDRRPQYGGSNITPLQVSGGSGNVSITVTNLGNGRPESDFRAIVAIKQTNGAVRYVYLNNGSGNFYVAPGEEPVLVVTNTPTTLYTYNAFESTDSSPERIGLNYQVVISGAAPRY
ncbi:MAG: LamG domain-containing protein [Firmicutes bacterium]|nr:LamG domain-containing protein [Bacillota bacterium]